MALDTGLSGKRALVTGGASGIGRAIALALGAEGADVVVADRASSSSAVVAELAALGVKAHGVVADVSEEADVIRMVAEAAAALGGLDLFVNNAAGTWHEAMSRVTRTGLEKSLATNLAASVYGCRETARLFIKGGSAILAVGSTATVSAQPRETAYRASKAALKAHIEVAAVELAPFRIRVNLLTPGATDTAFVADVPREQRERALAAVPLRREAEPEEMAAAALFLLSDRLAGYITGTELIVDGGLRLRPIFGGSDADLVALNSG